MNELQIFNSPDNQQIRVVLRDGESWFVAADVAKVLGYRDAHNMARRLDDDDKDTRLMSTPSGNQSMTIISTPGLYAAVLGSEIPGAKAFKRWVTHEVLPSIRKTGGYQMQPLTRREMLQQMLDAEIKFVRRFNQPFIDGRGQERQSITYLFKTCHLPWLHRRVVLGRAR